MPQTRCSVNVNLCTFLTIEQIYYSIKGRRIVRILRLIASLDSNE
ncbi:hypothetical protein GPLA_0576 [Paraglaciecola polaris LMG 21857]|uniref:Uncharacterized protein n=1 Tax=Paraglaciecola polaris LMG 21857 TaxID=1129793 RepID=K6ZRL6_9ALTE|nr:hypothetical protein GPLA_0576 [Paraglaciecola polaris LMG 21857]